MKSDEMDVKGNVSKEVLADVDDSAINESKKKNEGKRKTLKKASFSEIVSFSRLTLIGTCLFVLAIIATMLFGLASQELAGGRYAIALFGVTGLILFFGIVLDVLRWRDYSEWGALGAIIAYIGVFIMFLPLLLLPFIDLTFEGLLIIELIGGIITIIGFTSHRTDLDDKVVDLFTILWYRLRTFDFRAFFSTLWQLVRTTVGGFIRYIIQGLKNLPNRIRTFFSMIFSTLGNILKTSVNVIGQTLKRSLIGLWNNLHWIGLIAVIIYFIMVDLPIPNVDPILVKVELIIIIGFFFCLGVLYPQRDRVVQIAKSMRNTVLSGVISGYSMLSGAKIKAEEAAFCSRCLRGVDIREFESLIEIKGMVNPPCPFCGFNNWVGFEHTSASIDKFRREEKVEVQTTRKPVVKDIPPPEISYTIVDEKAIKKGKFPDYQSYQRAQNLGAQNYSELEYIDRIGAPDLEIAEKIRNGGFSHYKTFQKALGVGASNVSELRLVEDLNTPDLETAIRVQRGSFPDYPSYQRAHDLGARNYSELKFINRLQAPNYETALKMKRGKFPDHSSYERAQDLGASNYSELEEIDHYQAPDFDTVKKIRKGGFPNFQTFQEAQEAGVSSFSEYISIEIPELADHKVKPSKPDWLKEPELDQEEIEIISELKNLGVGRFSGRIYHLLQQLEKRPALSPRAIRIVKYYRNHEDFGIRSSVRRILENDRFKKNMKQKEERKREKVSETIQKVEQTPEIVVTELNIIKFRKKVVELGQSIDNIEWNITWHDWFLRQTELYLKTQITEDTYKIMLRSLQNQYLLQKNTDKMTVNGMQALDELRTLIDTILVGRTKLITDRPQEAKVSRPSIPSKQISKEEFVFTQDRESLKRAIEIFDGIFTDQALQPLNQELWTSKKKWLSTQKKRFLNGNISPKVFHDQLKSLYKVLRYTFEIPEERFQTVKPREAVVVEKTVKDLLKELLRVSQPLATADKKINEWHSWFVDQINLFLNSQLEEGVFQSMLNRSNKFLLEVDLLVDTDKIQDDELQALDETIALINNILTKSGELCPSCRKSIPKTSQYCTFCGTKLDRITH
ncbi:MAG: zinc ribbon domain-containing protein [Candidatus Heimdallarchaeota archaeon]|nr:MAG: zinc ribbon domain-containing protein [Candidatus Heimdallarchaeota archaeon]